MNRAEFISRWRAKAHASTDPFDTFFSAWIAIVIAARAHLDEGQLAQPDTDRIAVLQLFEANADLVAAVLAAEADATTWLSQRRGTATNGALLDVHGYSPGHLRQTFDTLVAVWAGAAQRKPRWVANASAEMLNHIRNNMFHGIKAPEDAADIELLRHVAPIMIGILDHL